ncbi:MAG: hypothetical protein RMK19_00900 [Bacteroidia bacterium]|nr:hypothetical protein [Bacteroidia bacterium]MDW8014551.1 hypothetical protein [Bacteroidia bacterium]
MTRDLLRERLTAFRAAYYRIWIARGLLLTLLWSGALFVLFSFTEGIFWWEVPVRWALWFLWVGGTAYGLGRWVVYPLLQYGFRLRGYLSDEEAARWIGRRLPAVQDKLLNALQLSRQETADAAAVALAIEERMQRLSFIPWEVTLPRQQVRKYLLLLLGVVAGGALFWLISPTVFRQGAQRFLQPHRAFARPLPYALHIEGLKPFYRQGETLLLRFSLSGEKLPSTLYVTDGRGLLPLQKRSPTLYELSLPNLQESLMLRVEANKELLRMFSISVLRPPFVKDFQIVCQYPAYTRLQSDTFYRPTFRVLQGSEIYVSFRVESERPYKVQAEAFSLRLEEGRWKGRFRARESGAYSILIRESYFTDSLFLHAEVFPDLHPSVHLYSEWFDEPTWDQHLRLRLMDDYGFSRALLWYRIAESTTPGRSFPQFRSMNVPISSQPIQDHVFRCNWRELGVQAGDRVEYYVEVWDNDALTGPKSSRSILYTFEPVNDAGRQEVFAQLQDSLFEELLKVRKDIEALLSEKDMAQSSQKATEMSERFRSLRSELRSLQRLALEQQLYTPELLKQMEQLQKLLESIDPQKPEQLLSQMQAPSRDSLRLSQLKEELRRAYQEWQEKLERLEALLPRYQRQRALESLLTRLSEMVEQQRQLSQLSDSLQKGAEPHQLHLKEEAEKLHKGVDSLKKEERGALRDSLGKAGEALRKASGYMQEALEEIQREGSPQESQENAAKALEQALQAIDRGMQQEGADEEAEDYEALRLLLKGILSLSFRQESTRKKAQESSSFISAAQPLISEQMNIRRDYRQIHDSLFMLAQRSPAIEEPILDLLREIERYFQGLSFTEAEPLIRRQQYILQGLNRLANLMTELLAQLEEGLKNRQQEGGACQRPFKVRRKSASIQSSSGRSPSGQRPLSQPTQRHTTLPLLQQLQKQLNEALERALTPNPASESMGGLSPEERARLSAQQELIRLRLQELLRQNPGEAGELQTLIEEMQKAERDLLIGAITRERLLRQQAILTRLLEYERSQQERELDPARESRTARQFFQRTTGSYPLPMQKAEPTSPAPALRFYQPLYQRLIETYFQKP